MSIDEAGSIDEAAFESLAAQTLQRFAARIEDATMELEVDLVEGVLNIETADGATYLVNKHSPLRQLWLSSPVSGAGHFDYNAANKTWESTRGGEPLEKILERELSAAAGAPVTLA
ncbi:MAG: iron donor protein CyaY [Proteobacteria bacterium]|nr:iron donor protein CyaY [Pseudomonadota bacterium]